MTVKRRLVGALVIVLLAIILVPAWLDGSARRLRDEDAFIVPLPPPDSRKPLVEPDSIGTQIKAEIPVLKPLPEPAPIVELAPVEVEKKAEKVAVVKPPAQKIAKVVKPAPEPMPEPVEVDLNKKTNPSLAVISKKPAIKVEVAKTAQVRANWIVQVGSFASRTNAQAMVNRLKKGKLKAFMRDFKSNGDSIYRVLVGPFVRQTEADDAKRSIDRQFQVKSFVANWRG